MSAGGGVGVTVSDDGVFVGGGVDVSAGGGVLVSTTGGGVSVFAGVESGGDEVLPETSAGAVPETGSVTEFVTGGNTVSDAISAAGGGATELSAGDVAAGCGTGGVTGGIPYWMMVGVVLFSNPSLPSLNITHDNDISILPDPV